MKSSSLGFFIVAVAILLLLAGCQQNLLRYGNRASCLGYFSEGQNNRGYPIPVIPKYAGMKMFWDEINNAFIMRDNNGILYVINQVGEVDEEQIIYIPWKGSSLDLVRNHKLATVTVGASESATVYVYSLQKAVLTNPLATIHRTSSPEFHPFELLLAGIHYPDGYEQGTNVIGVFDLKGPDPVLARTYELEDTALHEIFGWSSSGDVIAVSQDSEIGNIPYYIFSSDGAIDSSLFSTTPHSCVVDGWWSPDEELFAFSGVNEALEGWDIFLETVATSGNESGSLINLTNSPHEDERGAAWSTSGEQIAYTKAYEDQSGNLRQELFLIDLNDDSYSPIQLTDSLDEFETNPMWLSNSEIAYLDWEPTKGTWSLNLLSIAEPTPMKRSVIEIPQSWYE